MRIEKLKWNNGQGLEELISWGINPIKDLTYYLRIENDGHPLEFDSINRLYSLACMIEETAEKTEECIRRFMDELDELDKGGIS